jgi:hypothetical protein
LSQNIQVLLARKIKSIKPIASAVGSFHKALCCGHSALQTVWVPSAQITGVPEAQVEKEHPCSPGFPAGHSSTHFAPASQSTRQSASMHEKMQLLFGPQVQVPLAQTPSHWGLLPSQWTWHGPVRQSKTQVLPAEQSQSPFAHTPEHQSFPRQSTWQGALRH